MSEFKGSKGKWEVGENYNNKWIEIYCDKKNKSVSEAKGYGRIKVSEMKANAKLIACAPEMLEMLVRVIKEHKTDTKSWSTILEVEQLIKKATEL